MGPEDIKAVRKDLNCTARELAGALGIDQESVMAWERGDLFPTKRFVTKLEELRRAGPSAIPRKKRGAAPSSPAQALASPETWRLIRKLLAHPELRAAAAKLAEAYEDPAEETKE